jgi:hypothetical protein
METGMRVYALIAVAMLGLTAAAAAEVSPSCTTEPRSKWLSEAQMKERVTLLGYKYEILKVTKGGCYEIYGRDLAGKRVEVYFEPLRGDVVRKSP